ncbi:MAG: hypothetical protein KF868_10270 [Acidobacteria bacterium]|nr:hypothetical protein [Acidobacteriota bacterium]MCW5971672.1 hypothetical protein [Blastocatellales bacterium]
MKMDETTIPADLLELKARLDDWRAGRTHHRQPIPGDLREAVLEMSRLYMPSLVRRILKIDPWRLKKGTANKPARSRKKPKTEFFTLPPDAALPQTASSAPAPVPSCRLQVERTDGSRLSVTIPTLDLAALKRLCSDFLHS